MKNKFWNTDALMKATNGGLDVFRHYIPDIDNCLGNGKKFSLTGHCDQPAASIKKVAGEYRICCYNSGTFFMSAINMVQLKEQVDYYHAIEIIATRHNIKL